MFRASSFPILDLVVFQENNNKWLTEGQYKYRRSALQQYLLYAFHIFWPQDDDTTSSQDD